MDKTNKVKRFKNGPVNWLLGRQLIAGMKWIAVYTFFGEKLQPRNWMHTVLKDYSCDKYIQHQDGEDCFWFDYIADSGDDNKAVYNIAQLCMRDVWIDSNHVRPDAKVRVTSNGYRLPRGEFLFVGGDTAYHISDYPTLVERFQRPFNWAYKDIGESKHNNQKKTIFGIPGNHDYYDALDGFNRQFCKPSNDDGAYLELDGYTREQEASYVALKLPFEWMFWGLDTQKGKIDFRQKEFFLSTCGGCAMPPKKLIVATPEPTTVFGAWAYTNSGNQDTDQEPEIITTFKELHLPLCFSEKSNGNLETNMCRLDISGDVHHYARYWGTGTEPDPANTRMNYASVVAGGGGAFLHASHTDAGDVEPNKVYPSRKDSHNEMLRRLMLPSNIITGGYIWAVGALLVWVLYFGLTVPDSTWSIFSSTHNESALVPHEIRPCPGPDCCKDTLLQRIQCALAIDSINDNPYRHHYLDFVFVLLLLGLLAYGIRDARINVTKWVEASPSVWRRCKVTFLGMVGSIFALVILPFATGGDAPPYPAEASILSLLYIVNTIAIAVYSRKVADIIIQRKKFIDIQNEKGRKENTANEPYPDMLWSEQNIPIWLLIVTAFVAICIGFWYYGTNKAAIAFSDTINISLVGLTFIGLILLAMFGGGKLKTKGAWFWALIGLWHAFLQLSIAFMLTLYSQWIEIVVIVTTIISLTLLVPACFSWRKRESFTRDEQARLAWRLLISWVAVGLIAFLAIVITSMNRPPIDVTLWRMGCALMLGAILSCTWFAWYLAISLTFNGHNNEAGGGARSARYRHIVRIKLTKNRLTGYVIGVDTAYTQITDDTEFKLVDVFTVELHSNLAG